MISLYLDIKNFVEKHTSFVLDKEVFNHNTESTLYKAENQLELNEDEKTLIKKFHEHLSENREFYQINEFELKKVMRYK